MLKKITQFCGRLIKTFIPYHQCKSLQYNTAIVAIIKNEGDYIEEWVKYHRLIGVDHIYLYNNGSTDDTKTILEPYVHENFVTLIDFPGVGRQLPAYNDALKNYGKLCKYMAFIDADEFLYPIERKSVTEVLDEIIAKNTHAGGVAVNWRIYGSSGHVTKPNGGVLSNFLWRAKEDGTGNRCIKTIVQPQYVYTYAHVHYPTYLIGRYSIDENGERVDGWNHKMLEIKKIRINHYYTKSKEEWIKRRSMGKADSNNPEANKRTLDEFYQHDNNDIYDESMLYYVNKL